MTIMAKCVLCETNVPQDQMDWGMCPSCAAMTEYNETDNYIEFVAKGGFAVNIGLNPDDFDDPVADGASLWVTENVRVDTPDGYAGHGVIFVRDGALNNWVTVLPEYAGGDEVEITGVSAELNVSAMVDAWLRAGTPARWTGVVDEGE